MPGRDLSISARISSDLTDSRHIAGAYSFQIDACSLNFTLQLKAFSLNADCFIQFVMEKQVGIDTFNSSA